MRLSAAIIVAVLASASAARADHYNIDHSKDAYWERLLDNGRNAGFKFERSCHPNDPGIPPYCTLSMQSTDQSGKQIRLLEFYDANNELEYRAICIMKDLNLLTRSCFNLENDEATEEMYDSDRGVWTALSTRKEAAPGSNSYTSDIGRQQQGPSYTAFREWDTRTPRGVMHRLLGRAADNSMELIASENDDAGNIITSSTCYLRHDGWSDCTTNDGTHYQLKPSTIQYLYGDIPCPSAALCNR
jgi:hypothetical protein